MHFLFCLIIKPLYLIFEYLFDNIYDYSNNIGLSILLMSFIVSIICLPLYLRADELSEEEANIQKKLSKRVQSIKKNYKGDEKLFLLQTYYRQNNYNPIMALRLSLSLLLQIPVFIAAYTFFSHLSILQGMHCGLIHDLSLPDGIISFGSMHINILPILMTVVNIQAGYIYAKSKSFKDNKLLFIISLVFLILLYNSPSALVLYWLFNNLFSLIKNICLKFIPQKNMLNYALLTSFFILSAFCIIYHFSLKFIILLLLIIIFSRTNIIKNITFDYNKLFLLCIFALWILIGFFIPTNLISSSTTDFVFQDNSPVNILRDVMVSLFGLIIFWGYIVYYFANKEIKKVLAILLCYLLFLSITNLLYIKLPSAILSSILTFEITHTNFEQYILPSKIPYYIINLCLFCFITYKIFFSQRIKILNTFIVSIILTALSISIYHYAKIVHNSNIYYSKLANQQTLKSKYIHLSKSKKNVLILFADRAISSFLPIIFKEKPQLYEQFRGFTYYPNTLSYAGYTVLGYLPITGGYEYIPFNMDQTDEIFEEKYYKAMSVLPAIFSLNDYKSVVINPIVSPCDGASWEDYKINIDDKLNYYDYYKKYNIEPVDIPAKISVNLLKDFKLVNSEHSIRNFIYFCIMNVMPASSRADFYENGKYHNPTTLRNFFTEIFFKNYAEFFYLQDLTDFSEKDNTFTIYNNTLPHWSALLSYPDYNLSDKNDSSYVPPAEINDGSYTLQTYHVNATTLLFLGKYLDFLRKNGVYDNTRIIIVADHGAFYVQNRNLTDFLSENLIPYNPLLMVKDFNQNGKFKVSDKIMTNADVPYLATMNLIKNPKNPYTNKILTTNEKQNGIIIKQDWNWYPSLYVGKKKVLNADDKFIYVNGAPLVDRNWKTDLSYQQALDIYNKYITKNKQRN